MTHQLSPLRPAAQYLRMSDPSQRYSLENQASAIAEYAAAEGFEVVRSYEDAGISGVTAKRRVGLATLLSEVVSGGADFTAILVLDVTRWGRYQDADEAAHYEFMCRQAGVDVHYCGERFGNDATSPIMKQIKRVMAGEYSRELSVKVRRGKRRMAESGHAQGGGCPYGLQRREYHPDGSSGRLLLRRQRKSQPTYTVRFEKGPVHEVQVARRIFKQFIDFRMDAGEIAAHLNDRAEMWHDGSPWTSGRIRNVLACDLLVGTQGYAKTVRLLGQDSIERPRSEWRFVTVCPPIVPLAVFKAAQRRRVALDGTIGLTDGELIDDLKKVLALHGRLSVQLINDSPLCRHPSIYAKRFGSMLKTYAKVGYVPPKYVKGRSLDGDHITKEEMITELQRLERTFGRVTVERINEDIRVPAVWTLRRVFGSLPQAYAAAGVQWGRSYDHLNAQ